MGGNVVRTNEEGQSKEPLLKEGISTVDLLVLTRFDKLLLPVLLTALRQSAK